MSVSKSKQKSKNNLTKIFWKKVLILSITYVSIVVQEKVVQVQHTYDAKNLPQWAVLMAATAVEADILY